MCDLPEFPELTDDRIMCDGCGELFPEHLIELYDCDDCVQKGIENEEN